jgi:hypothetical protein
MTPLKLTMLIYNRCLLRDGRNTEYGIRNTCTYAMLLYEFELKRAEGLNGGWSSRDLCDSQFLKGALSSSSTPRPRPPS